MQFNKTKLIDPLEEKNKVFMEASKEATDTYLQENQNNPMAFMDVLKGSIAPLQETQIPFAPQEREPASIEQELPVDQIAQMEALNQSSPITPSNGAPVGNSNYDRILKELRAIRGGADSDIQAARKADSNNQLMDSLSKSANTIGDAFANRAGYTKIKSDPISFKSNLSEQAEGDRKRKLEDLMSEYKMISDKDTKDQDRAYKNKMLEAMKAKAAAKPIQLTKGQEALDREFAKEADKYTSSGKVNAMSSISKLEEIASDLEKEGDGLTSAGGGRTSILPDGLRSQKSVKWRDNAITSANATLKELFGAQLSDPERQSAAKEFYNDALSNKENAQILKRKVQDLKSGLANKDAKVKEFFDKGTLSQFSPNLNTSSFPDIETKILNFMKKNNISDKAKAMQILKDNGKL